MVSRSLKQDECPTRLVKLPTTARETRLPEERILTVTLKQTDWLYWWLQLRQRAEMNTMEQPPAGLQAILEKKPPVKPGTYRVMLHRFPLGIKGEEVQRMVERSTLFPLPFVLFIAVTLLRLQNRNLHEVITVVNPHLVWFQTPTCQCSPALIDVNLSMGDTTQKRWLFVSLDLHPNQEQCRWRKTVWLASLNPP